MTQYEEAQKEVAWFRLKLILFVLIMFGIGIGIYFTVTKEKFIPHHSHGRIHSYWHRPYVHYPYHRMYPYNYTYNYPISATTYHHCSTCNALNRSECNKCSNCGYCVNAKGEGYCTLGNSLLPDNKKDCIVYEHNNGKAQILKSS